MPVCPRCRRWLEVGDPCQSCGDVAAEMTVVDSGLVSEAESASQTITAEAWVPDHRPPTARLIAIDDDSKTLGQLWRLRKNETSIGRHQCDVSIDHDVDMSGRHALITRRQDDAGRWHWDLEDQTSTNGTFLRIARRTLVDQDQLRLGNHAFTWQWKTANEDPELIRCSWNNNRFRLRSRREVRIGRNRPTAEIAIDDPTLDPQHVVLRFEHDRWEIRDRESLNGVYVRIDKTRLESPSQFILGGQRFRFEIISADSHHADPHRQVPS